MSRSNAIKQFTEESLGITLPKEPRALTRQEVLFVVKMNCEELQELLQTVAVNENTRDMLLDVVRASKLPAPHIMRDEVDVIAEQVGGRCASP